MESVFTQCVTHDLVASHIHAQPIPEHISRQIQEIEKGGKSLKQLVRRTPIPLKHPIRKLLWQRIFCRQFAHNFENLVKNSGPLENVNVRPTCSFIDSGLQPRFHLNATGEQSVLRVLHELGREFSSLNYSPMLFPLVALLLHYMSEKEALEICKGLVKSPGSARSYITLSVKDWRQFTLCIMPLIHRHSKSLYKFLTTNSTNATTKSTSQTHKEIYAWSIFLWNLPLEHLVRIIDCFLIEGEKIFLRACIAVLKVFHRTRSSAGGDNRQANHLPAGSNLWDEMNAFLPNLGQHCGSQELLDKMFDIRAFSRKRIEASKASVLDSDEYHHFATLCTQLRNTGPRSAKQLAFTKSDANPSSFLTHEEWFAVLEKLEDRIACLMRPVLIFTTNVDGTSLKTLFQKVDQHGFTLMMIETTAGDVLGAFCSDAWSGRLVAKQAYFGRGLTFIFKLRPQLEFFMWVNRPEDRLMNLFMKGDLHGLYIGGAADGAAISLDENLSQGSSFPSATFNNAPLVAGNYFTVKLIEIFGFEEV